MDIETLRKQIKNKKRNVSDYKTKKAFQMKPKVFSFLLKIMILSIITLGSLIYTKVSDNNKQAFYDIVFKDNLSFAVINNFYNKYLGGIIPFKDIVNSNTPVFNEKLVYSEANVYKDGVALTVTKAYLVPALNS
ncbi:MAG: hypothetical protein WC343_12135, partial [Bacilli bacterium]